MFHPQSARRAIDPRNVGFGTLGQHDVVIAKAFVAPCTCKGGLQLLKRRAAMGSIAWIFDLKKRYECEEERRIRKRAEFICDPWSGRLVMTVVHRAFEGLINMI